MRGNRTLSLLRDRTPAVGAWLQLGSPAAARLLAAQGLLDWLPVDFEPEHPKMGFLVAEAAQRGRDLLQQKRGGG